MRFTSLLFLVFIVTSGLSAQTTVKGKLTNANTDNPVEGAFISVQYTKKGTSTDRQGNFEITGLNLGEQVLLIEIDGYEAVMQKITARENETIDLGILPLNPTTEAPSLLEEQDIIPVITLTESDLTGADAMGQNISGLLFASRDVFINTAAFNFGSARFRIRGYDSDNTTILLNGAPMNDLESGRVFWSAWGGLNDVVRNQEITIGLGANNNGFGGIGGITNIDTRASRQRRTLRFAYSISNRSYRNRTMLTYNTGMMSNGWAISLSGSRRWANEGYADGTFYDAYSYFLSVDRKLGKNHTIGLTFLGAPNKRGKLGAVTQEVYDLAGTNYYNPYWGYQSGEKRNSRVSNIHQPIAMLRYDWKMNKKSNLTVTATYQTGRNGGTALDWVDARDPRPDYYQRLPSYALNRGDEESAEKIENALLDDPALLTVDWSSMYNANRFGDPETIENANGSGESFTGLRSSYIVEDRRYDSEEANLNLIFQSLLSDRLTLNVGAGGQYYKGENFKVVEDLLGGEFYLDIDRFAVDDASSQNDVDTPNRIVQEGDRFGYDYDSNIQKSFGWAQLTYNLPRFDLFIAGRAEFTQFWRTGNVRNGRFPLGNDSFGDSEIKDFFTYGAKGGITFKLDGRNYFYANGYYGTRAPFFRNAMTAPRTRNEFIPNLTEETITSGEIGYNYRSPYFKARATAYYSQFENGVDIQSFFIDDLVTDQSANVSDFIFMTINGIDRLHFGGELAVEGRIIGGLSFNAVAAIGQYTFNSRPTTSIYTDSGRGAVVENRTIYMKNFYVPGTPQQAYSFGLKYSGKQYWFANLSFNYFDEIWMDFNPIRRTEEAVADISRDSEQFKSIIYQDGPNSGYTLDFFGGKSFRLADNYFLNFTVGVNNLLNNQELRTGGYEQGRFEIDDMGENDFPNRYYYMFGLNYFVNATFRVRI